jgi:hypothetical protein
MGRQDAQRLAVFVGASPREKRVATTLRTAQQLHSEVAPDLLLGAVAIPERHAGKGDEHLRLIAKQEAGCSYFVTQVVYDVKAAKDLVSDYAYVCRDRGLEPVPLVFTFSVTQEMLDFCAEHHRGAEIEVIGADKINEAWERVVTSDVRYRFMIDTSTFDN